MSVHENYNESELYIYIHIYIYIYIYICSRSSTAYEDNYSGFGMVPQDPK